MREALPFPFYSISFFLALSLGNDSLYTFRYIEASRSTVRRTMKTRPVYEASTKIRHER